MLTCEELQTMPAEDLNQRYGETFVEYNGVPTFIYGFSYDDEGKLRFGGRTNDYDDIERTFDYRLLNVERPRSRWYQTARGQCFYLSYRTHRQFHRGLHKGNTTLWAPDDDPHICWTTVNAIFSKENTVIHPKTAEDIEKFLSVGSPVILADLFCITNTRHLYYKVNQIGHFYENKIQLENHLFEQEMAELGLKHITARSRKTYYDPATGGIE